MTYKNQALENVKIMIENSISDYDAELSKPNIDKEQKDWMIAVRSSFYQSLAFIKVETEYQQRKAA